MRGSELQSFGFRLRSRGSVRNYVLQVEGISQ